MTQIARLFTGVRRLAVLAAASTLIAAPASAEINLRVESRPNTDPLEAFVRVTDGSGPVMALTSADFVVTLDGAPLGTFTLSLPPDQDPTQRVSVVFVVTEPLFTGSPIVDALTDFINQMVVGDYAAIIRFKPNIDDSLTRPVVQPLTQIDGDTGTNILIDFLSTPYRSRILHINLFDAMSTAVGQFASPPVALPNGPKAIILIGNSRDSFSTMAQSDVVAYANEHSIAIFTVGVGNIVENREVNSLMASLADDTGGTYLTASDGAQIDGTLVTVGGLLTNAYRLTIPQNAVTDCYPHVMAVTSQGQSESVAFTRCDSTPDEIEFTLRENVAPGTVVISDAVTITGIESPAKISVFDGEYSIGCSRTFAASSGFILPGSRVCIRHTASAASGDSTSTLLIVGGVSSWFWSSTSAVPPPPPAASVANGGGAAGVVELLFALGALFVRRRRS